MLMGKPFLQYQLLKRRMAKIICSDVGLGGDYPDVGTQTICNREDTIETQVLFERSHEIHCNRMTPFIRDWQGMQGTWQFGVGRFISLAVSTGGDVSLLEITLHVGPVVIILQCGIQLVQSKVPKVSCAKWYSCSHTSPTLGINRWEPMYHKPFTSFAPGTSVWHSFWLNGSEE